MAGTRPQDQGPAAYARQALSEWGKATRYGVRAITARRREASDHDRPPLKERLNPSHTSKGGRLGDAADLALSKLGTGGKLASKVSLGSRVIDRIRPFNGNRGHTETVKGQHGSNGSQEIDGDASLADSAVPIVESIDVGVALESAYRLCSDFDQYPEFLQHVVRVERTDDKHVAVDLKVHGRTRQLEVELVDERPNQRIDWECSAGIPHSGVISFHRLAPRLTRVELTIEPEQQGLVERLSRAIHLTDRTVRDELHRFKAFAELFEEDSGEPESSASDEEPEEAEEGVEAGGDEDLEPDDVVDDEIEADEEIVDDEEGDAYEEDEEDLEPDDVVDDEIEDEEEIVDDDDLDDAYEDEEDFEEDEEDFDEDEEDFEEDEEDFDEDEELEEEELEPAGSER